MAEDPVELRETFDGYLMFDFSNFYGLMAQTFDDPEDDNNDSMTQMNPNTQSDKPNLRKVSDAPGPYLDSPPHDIDNQIGDDGDVLFNGELGDDEDIPDLNLEDDDQCLSNFQNNSEFNLLANLDFEPDDDAYENAINLTANDPSTQNIRNKSVSERGKKVSIFSPTLQYEDNQELDKRIQMINIQNIELLKEDNNYDDFYKFLRELDFLNFSNFKSNEDHIKIEQLINLVEIRVKLERMCELFQKWTHQTPSISFSSRLQFFQLQLDHFNDIVNYIIDNGANRQKHFQPREGFVSFYSNNSHALQTSNHNDKQVNWRDRQNEILNVNSIFKSHTLSMSVAFFKAMEIIQQYQNFLYFRFQSEKFKKINACIKLLKSRRKLLNFVFSLNQQKEQKDDINQNAELRKRLYLEISSVLKENKENQESKVSNQSKDSKEQKEKKKLECLSYQQIDGNIIIIENQCEKSEHQQEEKQSQILYVVSRPFRQTFQKKQQKNNWQQYLQLSKEVNLDY